MNKAELRSGESQLDYRERKATERGHSIRLRHIKMDTYEPSCTKCKKTGWFALKGICYVS